MPSAISQKRLNPEVLSRWLALAVGFAIPLSTSLPEIGLVLLVGCWFLGGDLREKIALIRRNRVALGLILMFAALAIGTCYSPVSWKVATKALMKYRDYLYIPFLLAVFQDARIRAQGVYAFLGGMLAVLTLSYIEYFCKIDIGLLSQTDSVIFKDRIVHSLLMSFAVYLLAHEFVRWPRWRPLIALAMCLALVNILFMIQGRTGYVALCVLTLLFAVQYLGIRGVVYAGLLLALSVSLSVKFSKSVRERLEVTVGQIDNQFGNQKRRSNDPRMEFYENALLLISRHPVLGTGTGSFQSEYLKVAEEKNLMQINENGLKAPYDPHNEFLLTGVQLGLVGVGLLLCVLGSQWFAVSRLPLRERHVAQGLMAAIVAGCLFNSLLLGFTGGLLFSYFTALAFAPLSLKREASEVLVADSDAALQRASRNSWATQKAA